MAKKNPKAKTRVAEAQQHVKELKEAAEQAKRDLTEIQETQIELPFLVPLDDGSFPNFERRLTRDKLLELTGPVIQRTLDLCARCLDAGGISTGDIDEVLLVGGQTRMPAVREAVREFLVFITLLISMVFPMTGAMVIFS